MVKQITGHKKICWELPNNCTVIPFKLQPEMNCRRIYSKKLRCACQFNSVSSTHVAMAFYIRIVWALSFASSSSTLCIRNALSAPLKSFRIAPFYPCDAISGMLRLHYVRTCSATKNPIVRAMRSNLNTYHIMQPHKKFVCHP